MASPSFFDRTKMNTSAVARERDKIARRKAMCTCCKKAAKLAFSTVGLSIIVALYAVAGAFLFQVLEQTNEKEECIQVSSLIILLIGELNAAYTIQQMNSAWRVV